ncbi:hypothetical protein MRB53_028164 [Persea americana]|uniref:Uncharacterized protein n=1 Tax=Persea americana TaxID=3435 RepID=A0ACC2KER3_PERAE|nr:hypothetical protein MRB53_028164 [Persea americana]
MEGRVRGLIFKDLLQRISLMDETYRNRVATILQALYATKYAKEDNVPCQIEEGLFLGSIGVAHNKDILKRFNITHILIVAKSLDPAFPNDFIYKKIEVLDSPDTNLEQHFDECFNFIDEAKRMGGSVLVHCFAGKSRSVTIIVAYLMKKHHMSLSQALDIVRSKRPQAAPNYGFMLRLQKFEKSLRGQRQE